MTDVFIQDGLDTARLVAYYRAVESERPGALIHDPYARDLAGKRGEELMQAYARAKEELWAIALRTRIYDEILLRGIGQGQIDTVINLGAGLDARPYRLQLPASLRWIEVDLSALLEYKEECLPYEQAVCALERIPLDITDHEARQRLLAELSRNAKQVLVLTEGLLVYLPAEQVGSIARDLQEQDSIRWWLTEFAAPSALKKDEKSWNKIAAEKNQMRFSPEGGTAFFQQYGWDVAEFYPALEATLRFNAPVRFRWLLRLLMRIAPNQPGTGTAQTSFVLLKRASSSDAQKG